MKRTVRLAALVAALAGALPGAATAGVAEGYVRPIGNAPTTANPTPYTTALTCLSARARANGVRMPRVSVGRIGDMTGRVDFDTGAKIPQGAALFAITALGKAGVPVVERLDNSVAEIELNYARQHLLSDTPELAGSSGDNFRPIMAGQIAGSQYYMVGGVTELNYNIASSGLSGQVGAARLGGVRGTASGNGYVMNVAVDLRLVDTKSQEVVDMVSFQKQVVGRDLSLGVTGTVGDYGANITGGRGAIEPLQAAVRTLVERGVFELLAGLQDGAASNDCLQHG